MFKKSKTSQEESVITEELLSKIIESGYEVYIARGFSVDFKDIVWVVRIKPYNKEKSDPSFRGKFGESLNDVLTRAYDWLSK